MPVGWQNVYLQPLLGLGGGGGLYCFEITLRNPVSCISPIITQRFYNFSYFLGMYLAFGGAGFLFSFHPTAATMLRVDMDHKSQYMPSVFCALFKYSQSVYLHTQYSHMNQITQ